MVDVVRYANKFTSIDGATEVLFPTENYEYQAGQNYRTVLSSVPGASYGVDHGGSGPWAKDFGEEALRFVIWGDTGAGADADFDELVSGCFEIGEGKLWAVDQAGALRWAYARISARPSYQTDENAFSNIPVACRFIRTSDWQDDTETEHTESAITTQTYDFVVNNPGNARCYWVLIEFAFWFLNPKITNLTNGYSIQVSRNATVGGNSYVAINSELGTVKCSEDGSATLFDAYDLATLGDTQVGLFALDAGDNSLRVEFDSPPPTAETPFVSIYFDAPFH